MVPIALQDSLHEYSIAAFDSGAQHKNAMKPSWIDWRAESGEDEQDVMVQNVIVQFANRMAPTIALTMANPTAIQGTHLFSSRDLPSACAAS